GGRLVCAPRGREAGAIASTLLATVRSGGLGRPAHFRISDRRREAAERRFGRLRPCRPASPAAALARRAACTAGIAKAARSSTGTAPKRGCGGSVSTWLPE